MRLISLLDKRQLCHYLVQSRLLEYLSVQQEKRLRTGLSINSAWRDLPDHRHGKLFIGRPCQERANDLLKLSRHQLKMEVVILTGHASVRGHLYIMGLFDGNPTCRFCRMETETVQHAICYCEALARQRYNVFGKLIVEPKDTSTASVRGTFASL